jgi:hypothetical protein
MNLEFLITEAFDHDIKCLLLAQQKRIKTTINSISGSLLNGKSRFIESASMPHIFNLKDGYDSSLYLVGVGEGKKIVVAVDDDPIFNRLLLTLFRLVDEEKGNVTYKEVGEQLYKSFGILK